MEYLQYAIDFVLHIDVHMAELVAQYGMWIYAILFVIIFCETGLVVTPFLPGDSLLFVAGALASLPTNHVNVHLMILMLMAAAILGDAANYTIGRFFGERLFRNPNSKIFKQSSSRKRTILRETRRQDDHSRPFRPDRADVCAVRCRNGAYELPPFRVVQHHRRRSVGGAFFVCGVPVRRIGSGAAQSEIADRSYYLYFTRSDGGRNLAQQAQGEENRCEGGRISRYVFYCIFNAVVVADPPVETLSPG